MSQQNPIENITKLLPDATDCVKLSDGDAKLLMSHFLLDLKVFVCNRECEELS
jgi:hypothetical protein